MAPHNSKYVASRSDAHLYARTYRLRNQAHQRLCDFHSAKPGLAVPAVFWTTDAHLRVTSIQGNGLEALGIAADDLLGAPVQEHLAASNDHDPDSCAHRRALSGESTCFEASIGNFPVEIYLAPQLDRNGEITGTIGMAKLARGAGMPAVQNSAKITNIKRLRKRVRT